MQTVSECLTALESALEEISVLRPKDRQRIAAAIDALVRAIIRER